MENPSLPAEFAVCDGSGLFLPWNAKWLIMDVRAPKSEGSVGWYLSCPSVYFSEGALVSLRLTFIFLRFMLIQLAGWMGSENKYIIIINNYFQKYNRTAHLISKTKCVWLYEVCTISIWAGWFESLQFLGISLCNMIMILMLMLWYNRTCLVKKNLPGHKIEFERYLLYTGMHLYACTRVSFFFHTLNLDDRYAPR